MCKKFNQFIRKHLKILISLYTTIENSGKFLEGSRKFWKVPETYERKVLIDRKVLESSSRNSEIFYLVPIFRPWQEGVEVIHLKRLNTHFKVSILCPDKIIKKPSGDREGATLHSYGVQEGYSLIHGKARCKLSKIEKKWIPLSSQAENFRNYSLVPTL